MTKKLLAIVALLAAVPLAAAGAKGELARAEIRSPDQRASVRIIDAETLALLNPWIGGFADWNAGLAQTPPALEQAYPVWLYAETGRTGGELERIYLFYYHPNAGGQTGLVYVPGRGEAGYTRNVATIIDGREGRWHPATTGLDAAFRPLISGPLAAPPGRGSGLAFGAITAVTLLLIVTLFVGLQLLAPRPESAPRST